MRIHYITDGKRDRVLVRTNSIQAASRLDSVLLDLGMHQVGLLGKIKHILFWWRKRSDG